MKNNTLELSGNLFTYKNPICDCLIDTTHDDNGEIQYTFRIRAHVNNYHLYAYAPTKGLVKISTNENSIAKEQSVFEEILALDYNNVKTFQSFINKYGFFIPIDSSKYTSFSFGEVRFVISRFKTLVELIAQINNMSTDYNVVLRHVLFLALFFHSPKVITKNFPFCIHPFTKLWHKNTVEEINLLINPGTNDSYEKYYEIEDTFTHKQETISEFDYAEISGVFDDDDGYPQKHYTLIHLAKLYKNTTLENTKKSAKNLIDFLYHFYNEIGAIISVSPKEKLVEGNLNLNSTPIFNDTYKAFIISIAKQTIKEEFDSILHTIHPVYDIDNMTPNWEIPNLLVAIYFSLFYTDEKYEIYRPCANPSCNHFFRVKTTNSKRLYHDSNCQNAAAQMRHRQRKKYIQNKLYAD